MVCQNNFVKLAKKQSYLIVTKTYKLFHKWWNYITAQVKSVSKYSEVPLQVYVLLCFKEQSPITACFHGKPKNIYGLSAKLGKVAADL